MERYTVLTYVFGDAEILREPEEVSEFCDYVCLTDRDDLRSDVWRVVRVDEDYSYCRRTGCEFKDEWARAYLYKNRFLQYVDTDVVIRVDGSVQLRDCCDGVVEWFRDGGWDLAVMTHFARGSVKEEYAEWERLRGLPAECWKYYEKFGGDVDRNPYWQGLLESGFVICRNERYVSGLFRYVIIEWVNAYMACGDRLEQAWLTANVMEKVKELRVCFLHKRQAINSRFFQLCGHGSRQPIVNGYDAGEERRDWFMGEEVRTEFLI